ncbi:MAG: hypothetical protein JNN15_19355, partial [Blastocatellia bacterium]|nr:hypothetical protein [Blastocatellia bacterium]
IRFLQVKPKEVFPDSFLSHNVAVKLSRLATSNKTLNVVTFNSEASKIKIQKIDSDNNNKFSNKPKLDVVGVHINYKSKDKSNKPWIIDKIELPNSVCITKELNKLHTSNDRYISVDLWRQPVVLTSNESAIAPGEVVFKVRFHATSTVYNNLYVDSSERSISFSAVDPEIMPDLTGNRALSNNEILTLWNPQDNSSPNKGLMANIALERNINQRENRMLYTTLVFIIALVASILVILYYFYITAYHRIFGIKLDWDGSSDIVIDFDNLVPSHLLIGKIQITNPNPLPWFGKLLKNSSYPREETEIALSYTNLSEYGFSIKDKELPIGFLPKSSSLQESEKTDTSKKVILTDKITKHVAHQDDVNIFFATETIEDIFSISRVRELQEEITLNISVSWITLGQKNIVEKSWSFNLKAIPERATPPKADFIPANKGDFYFEKDKRIKLGYYDFTSRARHAFAEAFSDTYSLKAFRDGQPLKEGLLYLDPHSKEDITIPSMVGKSEKNNISIPVFLYCDGITVVNPTSDSHIYEFVLVGGDLAPESKSKKEQIKLFRDPKRSEIELKVFYRSSERFIYWAMDNIVKQKNISSREILDPNIKNNCVEFSAYKASIADKILNLVSLEIGNSAKSGDGRVEVTASPIFINNDPTLIKTRNTASLEKSLLSVYQKNKLQNSPIVVKEGEKSVKVDIRLNPSFIEKIEGTVISADKCRAEIKLFIAIYSHEGHKTADRELLLKIPLHLEQLPGSNWLCIDFGTSSIAAAFGIEGKEEGKIIDLQNIVVDKYGLNISYKEFDPINSERSTK